MKRRLFKLVLFLVLGAIVNVAVAWGCAAWLPWPHTAPFGAYREGFTRQGSVFSDWMDDVSVAVGVARVHSSWSTGASKFAGREPDRDAEEILPAWASFARPDESSPRSTVVSRIIDARGWPTVALWSGVESVGFPGPAAVIGNVIDVTNGYLLPNDRTKLYPSWANLRILPFAPIWTNFAINTIFYGAILWLLAFGPFAVRRFIRHKRGRCIKCAYDLRGAEHEVCPECGRGVATAMRPQSAR